MIADHPLFGIGPGQFQQFYARYKLPEASETIADPHNFLLEIWSTAGTPALRSLPSRSARATGEGRRGDAGVADDALGVALGLLLPSGAGGGAGCSARGLLRDLR